MQISPISNISFKAGRANILATADNHGNLKQLPRVLKTIENNSDEIFKDADKSSTQNFFAIVGDWFINPAKKGFFTKPELSNGDLQKMALMKTVDSVRKTVRDEAKSDKFHFHTLYTMGNHCLDSGTDFIVDVMKTTSLTSLVTNVNLEKSDKIAQAMKEHPKIVKSKVYDVPDDKDPDKKHKILFVGVTIPSMDFYNPGVCDGLEFYDNSNKKDANLNEDDIQGTINAVRKEVKAFKKENPKGVVVLLSHMGGRLSEIIQKNVPQINLILNGHDHENTQTNVGKTSVNSLGKDNEMIKAISIEFDDEGNCVRTIMTPYFPETTVADGLEKHPMQLFLNDNFQKDEVPLLSLYEEMPEETATLQKDLSETYMDRILVELGLKAIDGDTSKIKNEKLREFVVQEAEKQVEQTLGITKGITSLTYGNEIRFKNSLLMNFLTSAIKTQLAKQDDSIDIVGLPSSMVRGGLENGADNLKIMKVFDSVSEQLSELYSGNVTGRELVDLIAENVNDNLKAPTRNTIIHWSDIQVDRSMLENINKGESNAVPQYAIRVRNPHTKEFEYIDTSRDYKIVLPRKFLIKTDIKSANNIRDKFTPLNTTYDKTFRSYLESINYKIKINSETKEKRIL